MSKRKAIEVHLDHDDPAPSFCHCCDSNLNTDRIKVFYAVANGFGLPTPIFNCCKDQIEVVGWKDYKDDWTKEMWDLLDD